jgi:hypothetical protein
MILFQAFDYDGSDNKMECYTSSTGDILFNIQDIEDPLESLSIELSKEDVKELIEFLNNEYGRLD